MEQIFVYITDASSVTAYTLVFLTLIACGLGFPLPEDVPLIASGYLIWDHTMNWPGALTVTLAGVLIGDSILYHLGRRLGPAILRGASNNLIKPKKLNRGLHFFSKYGEKIVFFARFVAGFRAAVFFIAGVTKMPFGRFLLLDGLAALLSVPIWIGIGTWLGAQYGDEIEPLLAQVKTMKHFIISGIAVIALLTVIRFTLKYRRSKNSLDDNSEVPPAQS